MNKTILATALTLLSFFHGAALTNSYASSLRETPLVKAVQRAKRAVVNIHTEKSADSTHSVFGTTKRGKINGMGTGIVIDERGYVVTNNHVIAGVESLEVSLADGGRFPAHVVAFDRKHDLAIIKIDGKADLEVMPIGTSSDLMLGETVIAVGNAFGYVHTVTSGIVSSLSRDVEVNEEQQYKNLIQTDASINPGNSGGPLLNLEGNVIGINVAIRAGAQRIGFAIPIDDARAIISRLISVEVLEHYYHGLKTHDNKKADLRELVVDNVVKGSPADRAGFEKGDVIVRVGQNEILDAVDLERSFLGRDQKDNIQCIVKRGDSEEELSLSLVKSNEVENVSGVELPPQSEPTDSSENNAWNVLGMNLKKLPESQKSRVGSRYRGGMVVQSVRPHSPASASGIKPGDILVGLHVWETVNEENITYVLDHPQRSSFSPIKFFILRNGETLYGHLKIQSP